MKDDWCNKNVKYNDISNLDLKHSICSYTKDKKFIVFDITEDYIHYFNNNESRKGEMIYTNSSLKEKVVLLSNDNGYNPNIIKINFK